jgi:hypothetical protein
MSLELFFKDENILRNCTAYRLTRFVMRWVLMQEASLEFAKAVTG